MLKYIKFTVFILVLISESMAQVKTVLIHYDSETKYLLPEITEFLTANVSLSNQFEIVNLNLLERGLNDEALIKGLSYDINKQMYFIESDENLLKQNSKLANKIANYDLFLKINSKIHGDYIYFDFVLFSPSSLKPVEKKNNKFNGKIYTDKDFRTSNCFVDLKSSKYNSLYTALLRLFPEKNIKPKAIISCNEYDFGENKYSVELNKPFKLDSEKSYDPDKSSSSLLYLWTVVDTNHKITKEVKSHEDSIILTFNSEGTFIVKLKVFDGISYSESDSIILLSVKKPEIIVIYDEIDIYLYRSLFESTIKNYGENLVIKRRPTLSDSLYIVNDRGVVDSMEVLKKYVQFYGINKYYDDEINKNENESIFSFYKESKENSHKFTAEVKSDSTIKYSYKGNYQIFTIDQGIKSNVENVKVNLYNNGSNELSYNTGILQASLKEENDTIVSYNAFINFGLNVNIWKNIGVYFGASIYFPDLGGYNAGIYYKYRLGDSYFRADLGLLYLENEERSIKTFTGSFILGHSFSPNFTIEITAPLDVLFFKESNDLVSLIRVMGIGVVIN